MIRFLCVLLLLVDAILYAKFSVMASLGWIGCAILAARFLPTVSYAR